MTDVCLIELLPFESRWGVGRKRLWRLLIFMGECVNA